MTEHRKASANEIRAVDGSNGRQFWTMPVAYEVPDDYGTIWTRGVFTESAAERMPLLLYGHDWGNVDHVLGRAIDYKDGADGARALYELTDFDDHPHTRQVAAQINDGTLTDMSVGFDRKEWTGPTVGGRRAKGPLADADRELGAVERMLVAGWDETSLVVRGAVPGSKVLTGVRSVRTASGLLVPVDGAVELARKVAAGEVTQEEAQKALELLATDPEAGDPVADPPDDDTEIDPGELEAAEAEALDALDGLDG